VIMKKSKKNKTVNRRVLLSDKMPVSVKKESEESSVSTMDEEEEEDDSRKSESEKNNHTNIKQEELDIFENEEESVTAQTSSPNIPQHLDLDRKEDPYEESDTDNKDRYHNFVRFPPLYPRTERDYRYDMEGAQRYGSSSHQYSRGPGHHVYPYYLENSGYNNYTRPMYNNSFPPPLNITHNAPDYIDLPFQEVYPRSYDDNFIPSYERF